MVKALKVEVADDDIDGVIVVVDVETPAVFVTVVALAADELVTPTLVVD